MNKYKHLIFDLDGTVADTLEGITSSLNLTLKHLNYPFNYTEEETKSFIGKGSPHLLKMATKRNHITEEDISNIFDFYIPCQAEEQLKYAKIFPGLYDVLVELKNNDYKLYIATNKPVQLAKTLLDKLYGVNFFVEIIAQDEKIKKKPDSMVVDIIVNKYKLDRNECIYIGDCDVDILTAINSHIDSVLVTYGYGFYDKKYPQQPSYIASSPNELKKIFLDE